MESAFSIWAHPGTRQENIVYRAPWESFQTARKSHILSLLGIKPEFISVTPRNLHGSTAWQGTPWASQKTATSLEDIPPAGPSSWDVPGKHSSCLDTALSVLLANPVLVLGQWSE